MRDVYASGFRSDGLVQLYNALHGCSRYGHIDMVYSRALRGVYVPSAPSIGFKAHNSQILAGTAEGKLHKKSYRPGFKAIHSLASFNKRCILKRLKQKDLRLHVVLR